jgi:hypothetical protein
MKAKYPGKCHSCGDRYEPGTDIVAIPPQGKRARGVRATPAAIASSRRAPVPSGSSPQ